MNSRLTSAKWSKAIFALPLILLMAAPLARAAEHPVVTYLRDLASAQDRIMRQWVSTTQGMAKKRAYTLDLQLSDFSEWAWRAESSSGTQSELKRWASYRDHTGGTLANSFLKGLEALFGSLKPEEACPAHYVLTSNVPARAGAHYYECTRSVGDRSIELRMMFHASYDAGGGLALEVTSRTSNAEIIAQPRARTGFIAQELDYSCFDHEPGRPRANCQFDFRRVEYPLSRVGSGSEPLDPWVMMQPLSESIFDDFFGNPEFRDEKDNKKVRFERTQITQRSLGPSDVGFALWNSEWVRAFPSLWKDAAKRRLNADFTSTIF